LLERDSSFLKVDPRRPYLVAGRGEGGANGATVPCIQRVKLQILKCCSKMIFTIVSLPTHAAWI